MKLTRKRNYRPVTRRPKTMLNRHRNLEKICNNKFIKSVYDNNKSLIQNLNSVKLDEVCKDLPENYIKVTKKLSNDDKILIKTLINRYKDNYMSMARDIKTNYWQWNSDKCKKLCMMYMEEMETQENE